MRPVSLLHGGRGERNSAVEVPLDQLAEAARALEDLLQSR
jgi:hypothetical protein